MQMMRDRWMLLRVWMNNTGMMTGSDGDDGADGARNDDCGGI